MRLPGFVERWRRRRHGTYTIDDPRPIAEDAPYTYFLPSENELLALAPGDEAKIVFRSHPPSPEFDAERMWVEITAANGNDLIGRLDSSPRDMPQLKPDEVIAFKRSDVISVLWGEARTIMPPSAPDRREYWDRCLVDGCVIDGEVSVYYLYREEAEPTEPDESYPDSGWRIRGDYRDISQEELEAREVRYLALGAVLNRDDSWLHLIDAPTGSAFIRDGKNGEFVVAA